MESISNFTSIHKEKGGSERAELIKYFVDNLINKNKKTIFCQNDCN